MRSRTTLVDENQQHQEEVDEDWHHDSQNLDLVDGYN
jgi:hypothetical protein